MNTHRTISMALLAVTIAAGFAAPAFADGFTTLPQPMQEGNVTYISGGIGSDEQKALQSEAKNYDLLITNANKTGDFTADTNFTITSKNGREMISVTDTGPLFYAKLPPGEYTIKATNGDEHRVRDVKVSANKPTDIHLIWKQS